MQRLGASQQKMTACHDGPVSPLDYATVAPLDVEASPYIAAHALYTHSHVTPSPELWSAAYELPVLDERVPLDFDIPESNSASNLDARAAAPWMQVQELRMPVAQQPTRKTRKTRKTQETHTFQYRQESQANAEKNLTSQHEARAPTIAAGEHSQGMIHTVRRAKMMERLCLAFISRERLDVNFARHLSDELARTPQNDRIACLERVIYERIDATSALMHTLMESAAYMTDV